MFPPIKQAFGFSGPLEFRGDYSGLGDRHQVFGVNLNNFVQAFRAEEYAAVERHCPAGKARAGAARRYGNLLVLRELHYAAYLFGVLRLDHGPRHCLERGGLVMGIRLHVVSACNHKTVARYFPQARNQSRRKLVIILHGYMVINSGPP